MSNPNRCDKVSLIARLRPWVLSTVAVLWLSNSIAAFAAEGVPGLVKEKPADGRFVETDQGFMVPYTMTIPGTDVQFKMTPIPGGTFKMGSPASEENRSDDEGPQFTVEMQPYWMGTYEVTWAEYKKYMEMHDIFKQFQAKRIRTVNDDNQIDAITAPSNLYDPTFTFEAGSGPNEPAATMTQYAAKQYTKWLSKLTGQFYRLPSEAEWEYACRAGTQTAYYFGDDSGALDEYGWFEDNSESKRHDVGTKKPNAWGLYDMHGNVAEWVLDEHTEDGYERFDGKTVKAAATINWPTQVEQRVIRGGSFELDAAACRAAARMPSQDEEWKDQDPNVPLSPWWYTSPPGTGVGFRIVRPLSAPEKADEREKYWKADVEDIVLDVDFRINQEGRGALGVVDQDLPKAIDGLRGDNAGNGR